MILAGSIALPPSDPNAHSSLPYGKAKTALAKSALAKSNIAKLFNKMYVDDEVPGHKRLLIGRRRRFPWIYKYKPGQQWVELVVTLPFAVLLKELQVIILICLSLCSSLCISPSLSVSLSLFPSLSISLCLSFSSLSPLISVLWSCS